MDPIFFSIFFAMEYYSMNCFIWPRRNPAGAEAGFCLDNKVNTIAVDAKAYEVMEKSSLYIYATFMSIPECILKCCRDKSERSKPSYHWKQTYIRVIHQMSLQPKLFQEIT